MNKLESKFLISIFTLLPLIAIAQDDEGYIGGSSPAQDTVGIEETIRDALTNSRRGSSRKLSGPEWESMVLIRALRALESNTEPLASQIHSIFNPRELEALKDELNAAVLFTAETTASRLDVTCGAWNSSKLTRSDALAYSMSEYRKEDQRIESRINDRFQEVISKFSRDFGVTKADELQKVLDPLRSRYAAANATTLDVVLLADENGIEKLESLCEGRIK